MALPLSSIVSVTVNLSSPGITRQGFGTPLLLSNTGNAWATPELTRSYTSSSFATDFASGTVENAALTAIFSQPSPPSVVKVGKGPTKPTMVRTVTIGTIVNSTLYKINVYGPDASLSTTSLWSASYTSDASATRKEIVDNLAIALGNTGWVALTAYALGDRRTNDTGKLYEVITAGTSAGAGGPTGTGSDITDGTVHWKYIATPNFTVTDDDVTLTITGNAAGNWFAIEPIASTDPAAVSNLMAVTETTTDPGVKTDLDNILLADPDWYGLVVLFKSNAIVATANTGVSPWASANKRLFVVASSDTACATTSDTGATDILHNLKAAGGIYTAGQWHPRDYEFLDGCTLGYFLPLSPGSDNWTMKTLVGPTPVNFTTTQAGTDTSNLDVRRAGYYSTLGGINVLAGKGKVMSTTYAFIDVVRNLDWYTSNLQVDLVNLGIQANKVPNTNAGRRKIASTIAARNDAAIDAGVMSPDPLDPTNAIVPVMLPYTVTVPAVVAGSDPNFNSATRALSGISTTWRLAGAIDGMSVTVSVTQ